MGIDDFKYPIYEDRTYTITEKDTNRSFEVKGHILIAAYLLYMESLIPPKN